MKYFLIIFLTFKSIVFSQVNTLESKGIIETLNTTNLISGSGTWVNGKIEDKSILGSPYLFNNWIGVFNVSTKDGGSNKLFNLNYNLKTKTIESIISKDSIYQYDMSNIDFVNINNEKYDVFLSSKNDELNGLYKVLFENEKIKLYKEFKIYVLESTINPLTQEKISKDEYVQLFNYYFIKSDKFSNLKLNKSSVLNYLDDKRDLIKKYVNSNNLSYSNEIDVVKILNYYISI